MSNSDLPKVICSSTNYLYILYYANNFKKFIHNMRNVFNPTLGIIDIMKNNDAMQGRQTGGGGGVGGVSTPPEFGRVWRA